MAKEVNLHLLARVLVYLAESADQVEVVFRPMPHRIRHCQLTQLLQLWFGLESPSWSDARMIEGNNVKRLATVLLPYWDPTVIGMFHGYMFKFVLEMLTLEQEVELLTILETNYGQRINPVEQSE